MSVLKQLNLSSIVPNPFQPRKQFDDNAIEELAVSIKENGLLQPITVRKTSFHQYEIIAGERRYRALKSLGYTSAPCLVMDVDEAKMASLALIENIQREDLSPLEEANAYLEMLRLENITQQQLAQKLGKSQSALANKLRLLNLDDKVQEALNEGTISERHGRALLQLDSSQQQKMLETIITNELNVKQTEEYIRFHYTERKKTAHIKKSGISPRVVYNTVKEALKKFEKFGSSIQTAYAEKDNEVVMTITIKK